MDELPGLTLSVSCSSSASPPAGRSFRSRANRKAGKRLSRAWCVSGATSSTTDRWTRCSDFVADERNEPSYNPRMLRAEKISSGPVGVGTRFHAETTTMRGKAEMTVEITAYERPRRLGSSTHLSGMDIHGTLTFDPVTEGTRMRWLWKVEPRGLFKLMSPLIARIGRRQSKPSGPISSVSSRRQKDRLRRARKSEHRTTAGGYEVIGSYPRCPPTSRPRGGHPGRTGSRTSMTASARDVPSPVPPRRQKRAITREVRVQAGPISYSFGCSKTAWARCSCVPAEPEARPQGSGWEPSGSGAPRRLRWAISTSSRKPLVPCRPHPMGWSHWP